MENQEIAEQILEEFASEKDIDISECSNFREKSEKIRQTVEDSDSLSLTAEVTIDVTATLHHYSDVESILWSDWFDHADRNITREVADSGFRNSSDITGVSLDEVINF